MLALHEVLLADAHNEKHNNEKHTITDLCDDYTYAIQMEATVVV